MTVEKIFEIAGELFVYLTHASNIRRARKNCMHTKKKLHTMVVATKICIYLKAILSSKKAINIDVVYGVYFSDEGTMLGNVSPYIKTTI